MRDILKPHSGTPSGTGVSLKKSTNFWYFLRGGKFSKSRSKTRNLEENSQLSANNIPNFLFDLVHINLVSMFEKLKKKLQEDKESEGSELVEEKPLEAEISPPEEIRQDPEPRREPEPREETQKSEEIPSPEIQPQTQSVSTESQIGVSALMDKRVKLEEAIDYVGVMIKNLKDKRTKLEKDIEDESVDIKNLKEKLMKVNEYIEEENQGIHSLTKKRGAIENEADEVGNLINNLRGKLTGLDNIVTDEGERVKNFKETRPQS